jgi:hypothetical protein
MSHGQSTEMRWHLNYVLCMMGYHDELDDVMEYSLTIQLELGIDESVLYESKIDKFY